MAVAEKDKREGKELEVPPPVSDIVATGHGNVIPPAELGGPLPAPSGFYVGGEVLPDAASMSGKDQSRIEVLTGFRPQKDEADVPKVAEAMTEAEYKAEREAPAKRAAEKEKARRAALSGPEREREDKAEKAEEKAERERSAVPARPSSK